MSVHEAEDELEDGAAAVSSVCVCCCRVSLSIARAKAAPRLAAAELGCCRVSFSIALARAAPRPVAVEFECNTKSDDPAALLAPRAVGYSQQGSIKCPDGA